MTGADGLVFIYGPSGKRLTIVRRGEFVDVEITETTDGIDERLSFAIPIASVRDVCEAMFSLVSLAEAEKKK